MTSTAAIAQLPPSGRGRVKVETPCHALPKALDDVPLEGNHTPPAWSPASTARSTPASDIENYGTRKVSSHAAYLSNRSSQLGGDGSIGNVSLVEEATGVSFEREIGDASHPRIEIPTPSTRSGSPTSRASSEKMRTLFASLPRGSNNVEPASIPPPPSGTTRASRVGSPEMDRITKQFGGMLRFFATHQLEDPAWRAGPKKRRLDKQNSDQHDCRSALDSAFCHSASAGRRASYGGARGTWDAFLCNEEGVQAVPDPLATSPTDRATVARMRRTLEEAVEEGHGREEGGREEQVGGARSMWDTFPGHQEEFAHVNIDRAAARPKSNLSSMESTRLALEERAGEEQEDDQEVKEEGTACPTYSEAMAYSESVSASAVVAPSDAVLATAEMGHLSNEAADQELVLPCGPSENEKVSASPILLFCCCCCLCCWVL